MKQRSDIEQALAQAHAATGLFVFPPAPAARMARYVCAYCGSLHEWLALEPGPPRCASCGAPRRDTTTAAVSGAAGRLDLLYGFQTAAPAMHVLIK